MEEGHIFLIGFMGTGKTAVSKALSGMSGLEAVDTDHMIEACAGKSIPSIFAEDGEEYFRRLEAKVLAGLASRPRCIVSCGGGVPLRESNQCLLKAQGTAVLLTAAAGTVYNRLKGDRSRPLLKGHMNTGYIQEMMQQREPSYKKAASIIIDTEGKDVDTVCREILNQMGWKTEEK